MNDRISGRVSESRQLIASRYTSEHGLPDRPISSITASDGRIVAVSGADAYALGEDGRWAQTGSRPEPASVLVLDGLPPSASVLTSATTRDGEVWAVTSEGAFRLSNGSCIPLAPRAEAPALHPTLAPDAIVQGIFADGDGNVWVATDKGVCVTDGRDWWHPIDRVDGMPYEDVTSLAFAPNGDLWGGGARGALRLRAGKWRYFLGKRWLPGDVVNDIVISEDGTVWIATDGGVSAIREVEIDFDAKAERYESITRERHDRRGWIAASRLKVPGRTECGVVYRADDNDGLWTALYVAAEAFRYAVTGSQSALALSRRSMEAILDLVRLSGYPGYPARSIMREDEAIDGFDPDETVRIDGADEKIWYRSPVDPTLFCKGDTSSDELDGHYFAWFVYHELVASDEEKGELRRIVSAVTDNLLDNGYRLVGHTGKPTRWGVFAPEALNEDESWQEERGLNSASMLCYLRVAYHICGDERYMRAYEELVTDHHYLLNALEYRRGWSHEAINHSDDELAFLVYYPLAILEPDEDRRRIVVQTMSRAWSDIAAERSPFYNFIFGAVTGEDCRAEDAVETLREWPWELVQWSTRNSHRHDVSVRALHGGRLIETDRVLPICERRVWRWNGNPWVADGGDDGMSEEDGTAWLLPYWMGRYYGFIQGGVAQEDE